MVEPDIETLLEEWGRWLRSAGDIQGFSRSTIAKMMDERARKRKGKSKRQLRQRPQQYDKSGRPVVQITARGRETRQLRCPVIMVNSRAEHMDRAILTLSKPLRAAIMQRFCWHRSEVLAAANLRISRREYRNRLIQALDLLDEKRVDILDRKVVSIR